ncbi:V-type proton ATPase subunit B2 [Tanacetum coccineum]
MAWRHHDSSLSNLWKHAGRAFSLKDSEGKVITMAEFMRLPNFKGCKVSAGALLPPGAARVTHLASPAERLEDIPPKTGDMMTAEIPCQKVLDDKEKKKRKDEEKVVAYTADVDIQIDKPVSPNVSAGRMGVLRNQTDEHVPPLPLANAEVFVTGGDVVVVGGVCEGWGLEFRENVAACCNWGHDDNDGGIFGLQSSLGLTDSSRMDNSRQCRDMMSNLFTPADLEFFNEGVRNESAIKQSWKLLCQSVQQQANILLRFKALTEEHVDLVYAYDSCKNVKARFKECKKELATVWSTYDEKTSAYDQLSKNYDGALTREKSLQDMVEELKEEKKDSEQLSVKQVERIEQLKEALRQSEADAYQLRLNREKVMRKWSLGEVFSLAIGKGFIDGISIGRKDPDIQATPNVDPTSADIFMDRYEKLFDKRYPYVDKVARMYLLDPSGLQNVMPDETGPTPGGGHAILQRLLMLRYQYL